MTPEPLQQESPHKTSPGFISALVLGAALTPLNSTMIAIALPAIGESFAISASDLTFWLVSTYLLVNIILQSPAGKLGDMLGRRRAFAIGQTLFASGAVIAILVPQLSALIIARLLMAAGGAMLIPNAMALLRIVIHKDRRSRAFGYFGAFLSASAAIGPLIGGLLTQFFSWKAIFLVNLPLLLISWLLVKFDTSYQPPKKDASAEQPGFDYIGMLLLAIGLGILVAGLRSDGYWPLAAIAAGGLGLYLFVRWERHTPHPLIDLQLFRSIPFVVGGSIVGLQNLGMYALLFQLPFLLKAVLQLSPAETGQVLLTMTLFMVLFAPIGGRLSESLGARSTIIGGLTFSVIGLTTLLYTIGDASQIWMYLALACVGAGIGTVSGPAQAAGLSAVQHDQSGVGAGILSTMRYLGGIAGIAIISAILTATDTAGMLEQSKFCFQIYIGFTLFAIMLACLLPRRDLVGV
ncbi:MAG: EmrB/QacA subfamily drug resistance transporter [Gammaproteobacteria bacterium]